MDTNTIIDTILEEVRQIPKADFNPDYLREHEIKFKGNDEESIQDKGNFMTPDNVGASMDYAKFAKSYMRK